LPVPVTVAVNRCWQPDIVALPGVMPTTICGNMVTLADALAVLSAWLVAVTVTGFGEGTPEGAR
jgi:hypothetical protein